MVWAKDPAHGAVVAIWTRGVCDDQSHRAYCDLIDREIDGASRYPKPVFVSIMDEGFEGPNAAQRKEAAELMDRVPENVIYVLVTRSKLLRGVSVAMRWLKPPRFHLGADRLTSVTQPWVMVEESGFGVVGARG